jgi:hypothetical protein
MATYNECARPQLKWPANAAGVGPAHRRIHPGPQNCGIHGAVDEQLIGALARRFDAGSRSLVRRAGVLPAVENADGGAIADADVVGVSRPRRRMPDGAWSAGWRGGRQSGAALVITRR